MFKNWYLLTCPSGGIGRHKGLKIPRQKWRAGSSPAPGTKFKYVLKKNLVNYKSLFLFVDIIIK